MKQFSMVAVSSSTVSRNTILMKRLIISFLLTLCLYGAGISIASAEGGVTSDGTEVSYDKSQDVSAKTNTGGKVGIVGPILGGPGARGGSDTASKYVAKSGMSANTDIKSTISGWVKLLLSIAAIMAVVAIVWAGALFIFSFGDDGRRETAKKIILYVVAGIALILGSYAIVRLFMIANFNA